MGFLLIERSGDSPDRMADLAEMARQRLRITPMEMRSSKHLNRLPKPTGSMRLSA
jgi:hypothetical protein